MIILASAGNPLMNPDTGLFIWTTIIFLIFWGLIIKFAGGAIKSGLAKRNGDIQNALDKAEKARAEMENLKSENARMIAAAKAEQEQIIADANAAKIAIIEEAKAKAKEEADRILASTKLEIENQKQSAISQVKNESSLMALNIAEQIIKKQLGNQKDQDQLVGALINDIKLN